MPDNSITTDKELYADRILTDLKSNRSRRIDNEILLARVREDEKQYSGHIPTPSIAAAKRDDIERLALLDSLTELHNYRTFLKELKADINRSRRYKHSVSVCMVAIDNFAEIEKQYGLLTRDSVLQVIANVIREVLREIDIPSRYNEQLFAMILPQATAANAALSAERVRQRISNQAFNYNGRNFSVTASIGVASYPMHAQEYDELIARAYGALEYATARGGDRVFCA